MNPEESVKAFRDCGAELALAGDSGTVQLTDEPIDAPVKALTAARVAAASRRSAWTCAAGEVSNCQSHHKSVDVRPRISATNEVAGVSMINSITSSARPEAIG